MAQKKIKGSETAKSDVKHFFGTKAEWVKAELDIPVSKVFGEWEGFKETVVIAEDEQGLYVTGKSYVGASMLDPYRIYKRVVPEVITEGEQVSYRINQ